MPTKSEIVALDRNGDRLDCAAKVCGGAGLNQLRQMLADHDALFLGNGQQAPLVVMTLEAWGRLAQMPFA